MPSGDMARVVASVLAALETVATSHLDMAEALLVSIQSRESEQVVSVLEHGLAVLEKVSASSARKAHKAIDDLCERLEQALADTDFSGFSEHVLRAIGHYTAPPLKDGVEDISL